MRRRFQRIPFEDFPTWTVSKEDLIISELLWARESGSEMQLGDVRNLAATGFDETHIARWTQSLGIANLWAEYKA